MWYPNRLQWVVIWVVTLLVLFLWNTTVSYGRGEDEMTRFIKSVVIAGILIVWTLAKPKAQKPDVTADINHHVAAMVEAMVASGKYTATTATQLARQILGVQAGPGNARSERNEPRRSDSGDSDDALLRRLVEDGSIEIVEDR